jgi:VWFA-related protein
VRSSVALSLVWALVFGFQYTIPAAAQQTPTSAANPSSEAINDQTTVKFGVGTTLILVPVSVTDSSNRIVLGLEKQDFQVFEDGTEQKISQFSGEDAPISVGIIVDTSGSIGEKLDRSREAVSQFLKTMNEHDEAFLITFNQQAKLQVGFTAVSQRIEDKLVGIESSGYTALLDAVNVGLEEMKKAKNARKAILIISDGGDNISHYTPREIADVVRKADVQIYAMGVFEPIMLRLSSEEIGGPKLLSNLSQQTGGRIFAVANDNQLPLAAEKIGIELRNQYLLAYSTTNQDRDGSYRKIAVKVNPPKELPPVKVRWRQGYYAGSQ